MEKNLKKNRFIYVCVCIYACFGICGFGLHLKLTQHSKSTVLTLCKVMGIARI